MLEGRLICQILPKQNTYYFNEWVASENMKVYDKPVLTAGTGVGELKVGREKNAIKNIPQTCNDLKIDFQSKKTKQSSVWLQLEL